MKGERSWRLLQVEEEPNGMLQIVVERTTGLPQLPSPLEDEALVEKLAAIAEDHARLEDIGGPDTGSFIKVSNWETVVSAIIAALGR